MRILAISHEYPPLGGGGANAAYYLLNGIIDRGNPVTLVTTSFDRRIENNSSFTICGIDSKRTRKESCSFMEMFDFLRKAYKKSDGLIRNAIDEGKPYDIVLVFFGIPSGPIGYMLKKKYGLPYIIRFGGGDVPGFQKRFYVIYKLLGPAIKSIWRNADRRIANSSGLRQMALNYCSKYDFEVIPNGVDTDKFKPSDNDHTDENCINLLFASRLIERKGLQHIIPEINKINDNTDKDIRLIVVGDGPYRDYLEQLVHENKVDDLVEFVGEKKDEELVRQYQRGDIFILPSSNEGMPNVVLEAMACGLPVIMTPCQGSGELVDGNGYIADISAFPEKLVELCNDEKLRRDMSSISRERACRYFSWNNTINRYIDIIEEYNQ